MAQTAVTPDRSGSDDEFEDQFAPEETAIVGQDQGTKPEDIGTGIFPLGEAAKVTQPPVATAVNPPSSRPKKIRVSVNVAILIAAVGIIIGVLLSRVSAPTCPSPVVTPRVSDQQRPTLKEDRKKAYQRAILDDVLADFDDTIASSTSTASAAKPEKQLRKATRPGHNSGSVKTPAANADDLQASAGLALVLSTDAGKTSVSPLAFLIGAHEHENIAVINSLFPIGYDFYDNGSLVSDIVLEEQVAIFLRGYDRAMIACQSATSTDGPHLHKNSGIADAKADWRYSNALYLSSSSLYSPYFCINFPVAQVLLSPQERVEREMRLLKDVSARNQRRYQEDRLRREKELDAKSQHVGANVIGAWRELKTQGYGLDYATSPTDVFATSPIHNTDVMGYDHSGFLARQLFALGQPTTSSAGVQHVSYASVFHLMHDLTSGFVAIEKYVTGCKARDVCLCGPHMGLARHVVGYAKRNRAVVYVEPIIVGPVGEPKAKWRDQESDVVATLSGYSWTCTGMSGAADHDRVPHSKTGKRRTSETTKPVAVKTAPVEGTLEYFAESVFKTPLDALDEREMETHLQSPYAAYLRYDAALRRVLMGDGDAEFLVHKSITVEYIDIAEDTAETSSRSDHCGSATGSCKYPEQYVNQKGKRKIATVEGPEAFCIQYCQRMAYHIPSGSSLV